MQALGATDEQRAAEVTLSGSRSRLALLAVLACLLSIAAHAPSLGASFVWDDRILLKLPLVQKLHPFQDYFSGSFWNPTDTSPEKRMYFRPLATLSLALDQYVHGESASGFHLTNLVLHGGCVLFVFLLARRLGASGAGALAGSLFFGWFPRLTESVAWISGRTDLLSTLPALAALWLTMGKLRPRRWIAAALVCAALLSKEVGLAAACGITAFELGEPAPWRSKALRLLPLGLALGLFACLRIRAIGLFSQPPAFPLRTRALAGLEALARYTGMLMDGWQPRFQMGLPAHPELGLAALGALVLVGLPVAGALFWRGRWHESLETAAVLVTASAAVALVLHIWPIHVTVIAADRFLYLPLACLGAALGALLTRHWSRPSAVLAAAVLVSYVPATADRAAVWGDDIRFWTTAARETNGPNNAMSRVGLGNILADHGLYDDAIRALRTAHPSDLRNYIIARNNWAGTLATQGRLEEACVLTESMLKSYALPGFYRRLATLRASLNQVPEAEAAMALYVRLTSDPTKLAETRREVETAIHFGDELSRTGGPRHPDLLLLASDLDARLERVRTLLRLRIADVAFKEAALIMADPRVGKDRSRQMLLLGLDQAGPNELRVLHQHAKEQDPAFPADLDRVVEERLARTRRLQDAVGRLWRELGTGS